MPKYESEPSDFAAEFSKQERECAYWTFLVLVLLSYLVIGDQKLFLSALEDGGIWFSHSLLSANGILCLGIVTAMCCRCANTKSRAVMFGVALFLLIAITLVLYNFVFPSTYVPVVIDKHTVFFQNDTQDEHESQQAPSEQIFNATLRKMVDKQVEEGFSDFNNIMGFSLVPIIYLTCFGALIWIFRIDSGRAIAGTVFVAIIGIILFFKVMVIDPHKAHNSHAAATSTSLLSTAPVEHMGSVVRSGTSSMKALARLRGVEAKLDSLLDSIGTAQN